MATAGINYLSFLLLILMSILAISRSVDLGGCVYTLYIQTGTELGARTDSQVTATFSDRDGHKLQVENLEKWGGLMGPGYNYFERGNLDLFSGKAPCLPGPICDLKLTIDFTLNYPDWYPSYLQLTTTADKKNCTQKLFRVEQWVSPFNSVVKDLCHPKAAVMEDSSDSHSGLPSFVADGIPY